MRRLFAILLFVVGVAEAAPKLATYRYASWGFGPEHMYAGYNYIWKPAITWAFDATCDAATSACTSADYTPSSTDVFTPDPDTTPPGGVQNAVLEFKRPTYKAVNIGANGNAPGYWNLFQATAKNGTTAKQVVITSTATTRFYILSGYQVYPQMRRPVGWPTGVSFTYWSATTVETGCLSSGPVTNPSGYTIWPTLSSGVLKCAEVFIPASTTPGAYTVGWEWCLDTSANGCVQLLVSIVIDAPPQMTYATPAPVPMPTIYDQPTLCLSNIVTGTTVAGSNCSFTHLASGGAEQNGAAHWCQDRINPDTTLEAANYFIMFSNTGGGAQSTGLGFYYDAPRTYYHIAKWFNDPTWENCGRAVAARAAQIGPGAANWPGEGLGVGTANGTSSILGRYKNNSTPGYYASLHSAAQMNNSFPRGMEMGLSRFNGGKYSPTLVPDAWNTEMKNEIWNMIYYNGFSGFTANVGGGYGISDVRTTAYNFDGYTSFRTTGEPLYKMVGATPTLTAFGWHYQKSADALASMLLMFSQAGGESGNNWGRIGTQTWMLMGPAVESAINYWEQTREPRMAMAIKGILDVVITQYDWTQHAMPWVNAPKGVFCGGNLADRTADELWYNDGSLGSCGVPAYPELDGMSSYAFAWYWRYFGGDSYRALADEMFTYSLIGDASSLAYRYKPKPYYQNSKYWYEYLRYRLLAN